MNCRTFVNGKIFTGENETAFTDSITVEDGKIVAIGEKGRGELIDLQGQTVLPGLIDNHKVYC